MWFHSVNARMQCEGADVCSIVPATTITREVQAVFAAIDYAPPEVTWQQWN